MAKDDHKMSEADVFGAIIAVGHEIKIVSPERLKLLGVDMDPDWRQHVIACAFLGQVHGVHFHCDEDDCQHMGVARIFLSGHNAATIAASMIVHGEEVMGVTFTAALDQELARVRHLKSEEE